MGERINSRFHELTGESTPLTPPPPKNISHRRRSDLNLQCYSILLLKKKMFHNCEFVCRLRRSSERSAPSSSDPSRKWKCINTQHSRYDRACTVKLIEPCCCKLIDYSDRISTLLWLEIRDYDIQWNAEKLNCANKKFILMSIPFNWSSAFVVFRLGTLSIWTSATHSRM